MHPRKARRRDPDDGEVESAEANLAPEDRRIRSELVGPRLVGEHDDRVSSGHAIFVGTEEASERRLKLEHVEEVAADHKSQSASEPAGPADRRSW